MRILASAVFTGLVFLLVSGASAHAPNKVDLDFDLGDKELEVTVHHQVTDAAKHFVNSVVVELNGNKIIEQKIGEQEDLKFQILEYRITEARVGDTITVTAACNISGKKTASLTIAPPPEAKGEAEKAKGDQDDEDYEDDADN